MAKNLRQEGTGIGLRLRIGSIVLLCLSLVCTVAYFELDRSRSAMLREAEIKNTVQARVFAEYTRSTIKRIDEILLDIRPTWNGDANDFGLIVNSHHGLHPLS
jgi:hypothetical protein